MADFGKGVVCPWSNVEPNPRTRTLAGLNQHAHPAWSVGTYSHGLIDTQAVNVVINLNVVINRDIPKNSEMYLHPCLRKVTNEAIWLQRYTRHCEVYRIYPQLYVLVQIVVS